MRLSLVVLAQTGALLLSTVESYAFSKMQEITVLTIEGVDLAARRCGFHVNQDRVSSALAASHLTSSDLASGERSPSLKADVAATAARYESDRQKVCADSWDTFGPEGPFANFLTK